MEIMDLVNAAIGIKQAETMSQVQMAVAKKVMDTDRANGDAVLKLLSAATGGASQAGDALVASATGLGGEIDTYA
jgi:hypothetical protein